MPKTSTLTEYLAGVNAERRRCTMIALQYRHYNPRNKRYEDTMVGRMVAREILRAGKRWPGTEDFMGIWSNAGEKRTLSCQDTFAETRNEKNLREARRSIKELTKQMRGLNRKLGKKEAEILELKRQIHLMRLVQEDG